MPCLIKIAARRPRAKEGGREEEEKRSEISTGDAGRPCSRKAVAEPVAAPLCAARRPVTCIVIAHSNRSSPVDVIFLRVCIWLLITERLAV